MRAPTLWLNAHDAAHMVGHLGESAAIYDVTDDWSQVSQPSARRRRTIREDKRLCQRADAVIVCSEALRQSKTALCRHIYLVPNGVDAPHYAVASSHAKPPGTTLWSGTVLGYTGTLHGDRLDVELVRRLAGILGNTGSVVLIGPDHLSGSERERLRLPNVFLVGVVPYTRLPDYMHYFDACIVPHKVTPFTESLNPIKLWEYLALGKPIIATRIAGFRDYPGLVYLADGAEEFAGWARLAVGEDPRLPRERRAEAEAHSWENRCDAVEEVIFGCRIRRAQAEGAFKNTNA
ncbi:MAG: glycosyltransferase [Rhodospirillales bacterium]|nr:glycosyltransferase [Acetobacter sp.]